MKNFTRLGKFCQEKITGMVISLYLLISYIKLFNRLLKNRKSARKSRKRRKQELGDLRQEIKALKEENTMLRKKLQEKIGK